VKKAGFGASVYEWPEKTSDRAWGREQKSLARWLKALPKPAGVMASNDQRARHVLEAARARRRSRFPTSSAVIGVDNDETLCELSTPSISSVALDADTIGFQGAAMLARLMDGRRIPKRPELVPPLGVIARKSTDVLAMADPAVVAAVRFIEANISRPIRIADVLGVAAAQPQDARGPVPPRAGPDAARGAPAPPARAGEDAPPADRLAAQADRARGRLHLRGAPPPDLPARGGDDARPLPARCTAAADYGRAMPRSGRTIQATPVSAQSTDAAPSAHRYTRSPRCDRHPIAAANAVIAAERADGERDQIPRRLAGGRQRQAGQDPDQVRRPR
jgi:hypothetical protein